MSCKHVRHAHSQARLAYRNWVLGGKSRSGPIYEEMCKYRKIFKGRLKWCQNNQNQIKMDILASHHNDKDFGRFWKHTKKLNQTNSVPVSVNGVCDPAQIANVFREQFHVDAQLPQQRVLCADVPLPENHVSVTAKDIRDIIKNMKRGKSPGHDGLSIEHLQHAGPHLPRVLALLFTFCIGHSHLPEPLMKTVVVPIIKNRTGDASDGSNYRPISLATILAKILDSLLERQLSKHLHLHDAQFGFQPKLSTEAAILCLKHAVQYYTSRRTPVLACFLDMSKAFDMVSYDILWHKLTHDTDMPRDLISLFKYWYSNQKNVVRWGGAFSREYKLNCGVRQGGISSPKLFNLYIDRLVVELSRTKVGCSINGESFNNISYADDMVLLSPSISALRRLIETCESYAVAHGLRYNTNKSELMLFKAGSKSYSVPAVNLGGVPLPWVNHFKYLGHWVTDDLSDNMDIERERRALSVRCNMLAHRFAKCSAQVKVTLFKAYCQSLYTCSLWVSYTRRAYNALRVQYNNGFRVLLGLPRFCSASGMFADVHIDDFYAILRKRTASLLSRLRGSSNSLLAVVADNECTGHITRFWLSRLRPHTTLVSL